MPPDIIFFIRKCIMDMQYVKGCVKGIRKEQIRTDSIIQGIKSKDQASFNRNPKMRGAMVLI